MMTGNEMKAAVAFPPNVPFYRRKEAAAYVQSKWGIPCAAKTLAKLFVVGGGPLVRKAGRFPLYSAADLDEWEASKLSGPVRTSSELGAVA
jgi:hypothetical protein